VPARAAEGDRPTAMAGVAAAATANPAFDVRDAAAFADCVDVSTAKLEKLGGGMKFIEGPVWVPRPAAAGSTAPSTRAPDGKAAAGGFLVFSDIPADELKKWTPADGVTTYRPKPADWVMVNGNALDAAGRLIHCAHMTRAVLRTEPDGTVTTLADHFEGKKLNSPNDAVVASTGTVYFTDPPYGLPKGVASDLGFRGVYKLDPATKAIALLTKELGSPNGIALSPDERTLYVAVSDPKNPVIRAYPLAADGNLAGGTLAGDGRDLCRIDKGVPDGIKVDAAGRVWSSAGDGVHVFSADGKLLGKVLVPESPANLCFGGDDGHTLFVTAKTSLYSISVKTTAAKAGPRS
jgi:gluconolactonase